MDDYKIYPDFQWFTDQLNLLIEAIDLKQGTEEGTFKWLKDSHEEPMPEDLYQTDRLLFDRLDRPESECCAIAFQDCSMPPMTLNQFFVRMHFFTHCLMDQLYPEMNTEELDAAAMAENVGCYLGAIISHRYFKLPGLTSFMAREIVGMLADALSAKLFDTGRFQLKDYVKVTFECYRAFLRMEKEICQ